MVVLQLKNVKFFKREHEEFILSSDNVDANKKDTEKRTENTKESFIPGQS